VNEVDGDILASLDDCDLSLIIFNSHHRFKILQEVKLYQEKHAKTQKMDKKERLAKRMAEWQRENEEEKSEKEGRLEENEARSPKESVGVE
jgi:hypothetical protein